MKNPIRVTMTGVGVSGSPLLAKERPAGLTPAPGQSLSSCLLFTTDIGISIFCPTKIKRRWFLIVSESNL